MLRPALLLLALLTPTLAHAANPKIGVIDVEAAMNATDHWKKVVAQLQKVRTEKQAALEAKQKELKGKKDKIDAQKAVSDPKTLAKEEEQLYRDAQELTQGFMKIQQDLSLREKKMTDAMLSRIEMLVREVASAENIDYVFESGSAENPNVLYSQKSMLITPKVIELYNKRFKDKPLE
jgi:Skp family chaperone for outer membrane proteins